MTTGRADIEAANPATGQVLEQLHEQPPEALAEALDAVTARQAELKRWGDALEAELRRRLKLRGRKLYTWGEWEVEATIRRESVWDADQLESAMRQLADDETVRSAEMAGIITRDPVVSRSKAKQLRDRLTGDARELVDAACTWKEKPGRISVTRSVQLLPQEGEQPAESQPQSSPKEAARAPSSTPTHAPGDGARRPNPKLDPEELFA